MKKCPKCGRTYAELYSFCLEDGAVLSPPLDEIDQTTAVLSQAKTHSAPSAGRNKIWKLAVILSFSVFALGFAVTAIYFYSRKNQEIAGSNEVNKGNTGAKTTPTAAISPTISATSTPENNSNKPAENSNLKSNTNNPTLSPAKTPEKETPDAVVKKLKQGMPYASARKMLLDGGWQAVAQSPNRELFGQEEYVVNTLKYYEMEACSGTGAGYCRFLFRDVNKRKLAVVTVNNEEGVKGGPKVENWSFEK